jgi:hypothetical protein
VRLIQASDFRPASEQIFEDLNKPRVGIDGYGHQSFANGYKHIQISNSIRSVLPSKFCPELDSMKEIYFEDPVC